MRKTIIALIIVLPLLFVFVIFSAVNVVSIGVNIPVQKIEINKDSIEDIDEGGNLLVDIAEHKNYTVEVTVTPENATNKNYTLKSNNPEAVDVDESGKIIAKTEGEAVITAYSNDGNYTDSINVIAKSSKPYDFGFTLYSMLDDEKRDVLTYNNGTYSASGIETGNYGFELNVYPGDISADIELSCADNTAIIDQNSKQILLPFTGSVKLTLTLLDGADGYIRKTVDLNVRKPSSADSRILVNGAAGINTVFLSNDAEEVTFYVESPSAPEFAESEYYEAEVESLGNRRYKVNLAFTSTEEDRGEIEIAFSAGGNSARVRFSFSEFDFNIGIDNPTMRYEGGRTTAAVYRLSDVKFTAVSLVASGNVTYSWSASNAAVQLKNENSEVVTVNVPENVNSFILTAAASRNGNVIATRTVEVTAVTRVSSIIVTGIPKDTDLADRYTLGGKEYNEEGELTDCGLEVNLITYGVSGKVDGFSEVDFSVSSDIIKVERGENNFIFKAAGEGEASVTFFWKSNELFGKNVRTTQTLNVVSDGVQVSTYSRLCDAAKAGYKVVLTDDIMLGSDDEGNPLPESARREILNNQRITSTYNIEWYGQAKEMSKEYAKTTYAFEIKNDIYGNGHNINSDYLSNALDGTGEVPLFDAYRDPLYFVKYGDTASVAGQDNCAFLVRTDGITLYGVNLLGCLDEALYENNQYMISRLNHVGTTLEVNASVDIVNCRIRNGRNVVRTYGGNRNGDNYFLGMLSQNPGCDGERILVNIDGCILSHGREFILKVGANRALRASLGNPEPALTDENGMPYGTSDGNGKSNNYDLLHDDYFYRMYVMTDVTVKDTVIETSGLFAIGVESNFAGVMLTDGYTGDYSAMTSEWRASGGTSFASVLRLVGDVRMYEWKDLEKIDSSTLIESPIGALSAWLKLDFKTMFDYVNSTNPEIYSGLIHNEGDAKFAHGGIAYYGGGLNYSQLSLEGLNEDINCLNKYNINISILKGSSDANLQREGEWLPRAAGTNDFRFYTYSDNSGNFNYARQLSDEANGTKYDGVKKKNVF